MNEPRRWLSEPPEDPLLSDWLRAGASELPSQEVLARCAHSLGIPPIAGVTPTLHVEAELAKQTTSLRIPVSLVTTTSKVMLALIAMTIVPVVFYWTRPERPRARPSPPSELAPRQDAAATSAAPATTLVEPVTTIAEPYTAPHVTEDSSRVVVTSKRQRHTSRDSQKGQMRPPSSPPSANESAVPSTEELALLQRAQKMLADDPQAARLLLEEHERRFVDSWLDEERDGLMIRVLLSCGEYDKARALFARFLVAHPHSPQRKVLREILR